MTTKHRLTENSNSWEYNADAIWEYGARGVVSITNLSADDLLVSEQSYQYPTIGGPKMGLITSDMSYYQHKALIDLLAGQSDLSAGRKLDLSKLSLDSLYGNLHLDMYKVSAHQYPGLKKNKNIYQNITEDSLGSKVTKIIGTKGDDYIAGGYLGEQIYGGRGNDVLVGRGGDDTLKGARGNDILCPGTGTNTLDGGKGKDTAYFTFLTPIVINYGTEDAAAVSLFDDSVDTSNLFSDDDRTALTELLADHSDIGNINIDLWVRLSEGYAYSLFNTAVDIEGYDPKNPSAPTPIAEKTSLRSIENISVDAWHSSYGLNRTDSESAKAFANTIIEGDSKANNLIGGKAQDWIFGHDGKDKIAGGNGDDTLYGGEGRDRIFGGGDADLIYGDAGNDFLHGGSGRDTITDFSLAEGDKIRLEGKSVVDLLLGNNVDGNLLVIDSATNATLVTFEGINYASLDPNNTDVLFELA